MKALPILLICVLALSSFSVNLHSTNATSYLYLQTGAYVPNSIGNTGANVTIQTVLGSKATTGFPDIGAWIGEGILGGFVQVGYIRALNSYLAHPFYEFFGPNFTGGAEVCTCSAGLNGSWHVYSMISTNGWWNFYFDNQFLGSVAWITLGGMNENSSTGNTVAILEDAQTLSTSDYISPVSFEDLSYFKNGLLTRATSGDAYVSSSQYSGPWMYGIQADSQFGRFSVGTGLPIVQSDIQIWSYSDAQIYSLEALSQFGKTSGSGDYLPGDMATIAITPASFNDSKSDLSYSFANWTGNAYNGPASITTFEVTQSVYEIAIWNVSNLALSILASENQTIHALLTNQTKLNTQVSKLQTYSMNLYNQVGLLNSTILSLKASNQLLNQSNTRLLLNRTTLENNLAQTKASYENIISNMKQSIIELEAVCLIFVTVTLGEAFLLLKKRKTSG